ncbi:protein kinase, ATP binding site-containing protein [Tanacetum coccineum]
MLSKNEFGDVIEVYDDEEDCFEMMGGAEGDDDVVYFHNNNGGGRFGIDGWKLSEDGDFKVKELDHIIPLLYHENIIPFYSEDVYIKNAIIGTLNNYLQEEKRCNFTWAQRLKACLGVAKGLSYLHSGVGDHGRVIHGSVRSHSILLNENLEAKIGGLYGSVLLRVNQPLPEIYRPRKLNSLSSCSTDPVYLESDILNIESDIYSYGILMFEILTGMECDGHDQGRAIGDYKEQKMINMVLRFHDGGSEQLIDPYITDDVDRRSFHRFIEIAYKCISLNIEDRPKMDKIVKTIEEALDIQDRKPSSFDLVNIRLIY